MLEVNERESKLINNGIYFMILFSKGIPEMEIFTTDILTLYASPVINLNLQHK